MFSCGFEDDYRVSRRSKQARKRESIIWVSVCSTTSRWTSKQSTFPLSSTICTIIIILNPDASPSTPPRLLLAAELAIGFLFSLDWPTKWSLRVHASTHICPPGNGGSSLFLRPVHSNVNRKILCAITNGNATRSFSYTLPDSTNSKCHQLYGKQQN